MVVKWLTLFLEKYPSFRNRFIHARFVEGRNFKITYKKCNTSIKTEAMVSEIDPLYSSVIMMFVLKVVHL